MCGFWRLVELGKTQVCECWCMGECIAGKGEVVFGINEVRQNWRRIISGMKKNNCFGIKK